MPKYTVYLMTPYCVYEGIEAESDEEAIQQCEIPDELDCNEPYTFKVIKED